MKKFRIFLAMALCLSLLTFAGCGNRGNADTVNDGTVTEETTDRNDTNHENDADNNDKGNTDKNDNTGNSDGTVGEDLADGAKKAIDDVENAVDGNDTNK